MNTAKELAVLPLFDVCEKKHGGASDSVDAFATIDKTAGHAIVLGVLKRCGPMTSKEIAAALGTTINCISGRLSELKVLGTIKKTGVRREKAAEVVIA